MLKHNFHHSPVGNLDIFFLLLIVLFMSYQIQCQVTKCCPIGFIVNINTTSEYYCESIVDHNISWNAVNIMPSSTPKCGPVHSVFEQDETFIKLNGCLDKDLNNQIVAISCQNSPVNGVHLINKCCPNGHSYSHKERCCIQNSGSRVNIEWLFANISVVFKNEVPDCSEDEVFVEYSSISHHIEFNGANLKVNDDALPPNKFCVEYLSNIEPYEMNESEKHLVIRSCRPRSICNQIPCMRRCCKVDEVIEAQPEGTKDCQIHPNKLNLIPIFYNVSLPLNNPQVQVHPKDYGMLENWKCKKVFKLDPNNPDDVNYLHIDGLLYMADQQPYSPESYCIENALSPNGSTIVSAFLCFDAEIYEQLAKHDYYPYGLLVSCIFLAVTLIVYLSLPKLQNLHGKTLICYVTSFLAVYITLAILQFNHQDRSGFCFEVAFFLLYCLIAAFCWQTAMCFDIWLTFGSLRSSFVMRHNSRNRRKFFYYSIYAWGVPLAWILFTMYAEKFKPLPDNWNPIIGETTCFFDRSVNWRNHFLFFVVPAGLHVLINCILFVVTAIRCSRVKNEIHRMQSRVDESSTSTKRRKFIVSRAMFVFIMNLKLFTVMGISWILEIISTFSTNETTEFVLDTYNIFIGVFIFIIFVFKRKVLYELKCRFGIEVKNTGTATPRSTTITHTGNITMKDITSDRGLPLLTSSTATLRGPTSVKK